VRPQDGPGATRGCRGRGAGLAGACGLLGGGTALFFTCEPLGTPRRQETPLVAIGDGPGATIGGRAGLEPWPSPGASWGLLGRQFPPLDQRAHSNRKLRFQGFCRSIRLIERVFGSFYSTVRSDMQSWLAFSWPYNLLSDKVLRITVYSCANAPAGPTCRTLLLGGSAKP